MHSPVLAQVKVSPRVRQAALLYGSGAVRTKKAASEMAGLHPNYLTMLTNAGNPEVGRIISETQRLIEDETVSMSSVLSMLGRRAIGEIATLMEFSASEKIKLEAAKDLADRTPQTAKTQMHQVTSLTIAGEDAKELAKALVNSANAHRQYSTEVLGDFVRVNQGVADDKELAALPNVEEVTDAK